MDFFEIYIPIVEKFINRDIEPSDGIDPAKVKEVELNLKITFPLAIKQYYQLAGDIELINCFHNQIYKADEIKIIDDKLIFMEENQSICYWGIDLVANSDNPEVYQGRLDEGKEIKWYSEEMSFSEFIVKMLEWEFKL